MLDASLTFVLVVVVIALIFDFINGFHDSANSIATVVATRVLSPGVAVTWAALFNFAAAFVVGTAVAKTVSKGLIDPSIVTPTVLCAVSATIADWPYAPAAANAFRSAWMPAPPPESDVAMVKQRGTISISLRRYEPDQVLRV